MEQEQVFQRFYNVIAEDGRIGPVHISVYMALLHLWMRQGYKNPIHIFSREVMPLAKISGIATYYRALKELNKYGYIKYISTYDRILGSLVYMVEIKK
jgi:hypothetical protein